jgi:hypothetical protein
MKIFFKSRTVVFVLGIAYTFLFLGCKTKNAAVTVTKTENKKSISKIVDNYTNNKNEFSTLYIKANAQYVTDKQNQKVTAEIKIKKDQQILISIRFLGITMAKASITPLAVSYYEKINRTYYEGDFSALSQLLVTELDYYKVQNIILGRAIDNLKEGKYIETLNDQTYILEAVGDKTTKKTFYLDAKTYTIDKQEIVQPQAARMIQLLYSSKKVFNEMTMPLQIDIDSKQGQFKAGISLEYTSVNFNEELSFPYSIPSDYKRILIK